jgi:predicted nucleic acid-binding protein
LHISVISEIELFSKPAMPLEEENGLRVFLSKRIGITDITGDIKKETIELRRNTKLKLPDCIIAATSIVLNAILLTDDDDLLKLSHPGFRVQNH